MVCRVGIKLSKIKYCNRFDKIAGNVIGTLTNYSFVITEREKVKQFLENEAQGSLKEGLHFVFSRHY